MIATEAAATNKAGIASVLSKCLKTFIKFIGVTLINKIRQISSIQFYDTLSVYCTVFTTQREISCRHIFDPFYPFLPPPIPLFLW